MGDESRFELRGLEIHASWEGERRRNKEGWTKKRWGEAMEAIFLTKVVEMGFGVARPWGDSEPYDFIVHGRRLWRVQVKATRNLQSTQYVVPARGCTKSYTAAEIDFLVAYVEPEDTWYVIPVKALEGRQYVGLHPTGCRRGPGLFEKYKEAWRLMGREK